MMAQRLTVLWENGVHGLLVPIPVVARPYSNVQGPSSFHQGMVVARVAIVMNAAIAHFHPVHTLEVEKGHTNASAATTMLLDWCDLLV